MRGAALSGGTVHGNEVNIPTQRTKHAFQHTHTTHTQDSREAQRQADSRPPAWINRKGDLAIKVVAPVFSIGGE